MSFVVKATIIGSSDAYTPVCYGLSSDISKITFKVNGTSVDIIDVPDDEQHSWFSIRLAQGKTLTVEVSGSSEDLITFERNNYLQSIIIQNATIIPELWVYNCEILQSVSILEGVTSIGRAAFAECPILSGEIIIPDSVTSTDTSVFSRCPGITSVTLGSGLTGIAYFMFSECTGLTNIIIPDNVRTIGTYSFQNCESLTNIDIPGNVYFIGEGAFSRCTGLTNVVIPDSVQTGYEYIFDGCTNLTSVTIGSKMRSIGYGIFRDCPNLSSVTVSSNNPYYDSRGNCNAIIETSSNTLIAGCKNTVIPGDVTTIYMTAFSGSGITSVTIPDSVITIENYAFDACSNMTNLTIGSGLASIGEDAFRECSSLKSIVVSPNNTIYDSREGCNYIIETATNKIIVGSDNTLIPNSIIAIGKRAFKYCNITGELIIPNGVTTIEYEAFFGSNLTGLTIPNSVTNIGVRAFYQCSGLTGELVIPDSVTELGGSAFDECTGLTSVVTGSGITTICGFDGCTGLTNVTIGPNVTTIDLFAFGHCTGLTSIVIPDSVQTIGQSAFLGCTSLLDVTIGSGVTTLKQYAFSGCTSLNTITSYATTAPSLDSTTFYNIKSNGTLCYPTGSTYSTWLRTAPHYLGYYGWTNKTRVDSDLDVPVGGGTYPIFFNSNGWEMISFPDWIIPSSTSGTGNIDFDLVVKQNINEEERTGEVIFSTNSVLYTINVNQEALTMRINGVISFDNAGGEKNIRIREWNLKPNSFRIEIEDLWKNIYSSRYELTDTEANIYVTALAIGGYINILCDLYVYAVYDDGEYLIKEYITQNGKNYVVTPDAVAFGTEGGTVTITLTSDYTLSYYTSVESKYGNSTLEIISDTEYRITCVVPPGQETIQFQPKLTTTYKQGSTGINNISLTEISRSLPSGFIGTVPAGKVRLGGILTTFYDSGQRLPTSVARYVVNGEIIEPYIEDPAAPNSTYYGVYYDFDEPTTIDIQLSVNNSALMSLLDGDYLTIQAYGLTGLESLYHLCEDCSQLTSIDLSCITNSSIESIGGIFERCYSLTEIIWPEENIWDDVVDCSSSFTGTPIVEWNMPINPGRVREMFYGCSQLKSITINGWKDPLGIDEGYYMFKDCTSLKEIYLNSTFIPVMYVTTQVAEYGTLYVPPEAENLPWRTTSYWTLLFDKYYWNLKTYESEPIWDFPTDPIYFDNDGGFVNIKFTSSVEIENIIISNVPDWLTFTRKGNTITVVASENNAATPRTATVTFEAEGFNEIRTVVITQELAELSKSFDSWLYVYPADINGYVATNVPIVLTCNIWNPGYSWEITTWQGEFETDCKAVVDHFETTNNLATVYLNLFSLVLVWHNAKFNVKIKNGDAVVYETVVDIKWQAVRSNGIVWHQDYGVSTGVVVNTMPREKEFVSIIAPASYGRIRGELYNYNYEKINRSYVTGDLSKEWSLSLFDYELIQAKTDNTTGKIRDCVGTYTMGNNSLNVENTVPITIRQVYTEKYTCIAEERIPYNKTCISFAFGGIMPYKYNIKVPNYVQYIQFEDTQNWECYTAVLYGLEVNDSEEDRIITIPYDVMDGDTIVESGEMRIVQEAQFGVSQDTITVPVEGGEYYIEISAFEDWTIETSGAFFTVDPMSGSGDGGFLIKVLENDSVDMREGIIYVKSGGEVVEIRVIQEAVDPSLYFGKHYIPVRRAGELVRLMLYTNIRWTTEWVTL